MMFERNYFCCFFRSLRGRGRLKNESQSLILPWWSSWATVRCALTTKHSKQTGSNSNNIKHRELSLTARDHYSVSPHLLWPHFVAQPDRIINPIHAALCSCKEDQCWVHWSPCTRHCRCAAFIWKSITCTVTRVKRLTTKKAFIFYVVPAPWALHFERHTAQWIVQVGYCHRKQHSPV